MIIIDYSGVTVAALMAQTRGTEKIDEALLRHTVLNAIRAFNVRFRKEYGPDVYLTCDTRSWRKKEFPLYKAARKKSRDDSNLDWDMVFEFFGRVSTELQENSPFKVLRVDGAEADDIIAVLVESTQDFGKNEPVMIVSNDKDFLQLQKYSNVDQYSPMKQKKINEINPHAYLKQHIFRGDSSDGIPNILSDDDTFVSDKRQKPLTKKVLKPLMESTDIKKELSEEHYRNWQRNRRLVELSSDVIPSDIVKNILEEREKEDTRSLKKDRFLNYLIQNRCTRLIDSLAEFYPL